MNPVVIIVCNSILLAGGILMIFIPCAISENWWPLLSVLFFLISLIPPVLCNACNTSNDMWDDGNHTELGKLLSWLLTGVFVTIGYSIPFEFWRVVMLSLVEFLLTCGGGTIILISILIFQFLINKRGD